MAEMSPPKKPKDNRKSLLSAGGTPIRMLAMYIGNADARKEFRQETKEYEKKKKAYDAAMREIAVSKDQKKAKTSTRDIRNQAYRQAAKRAK